MPLVVVLDAQTLARNWWVFLLRGIASIVFAVATLFAPGISLAALVLVFGAYAFADGVLAIVAAITRRGAGAPWWLLVLEGIAGIAVGVVAFVWPAATALALLYLIAAWAFVTGIFAIAAAIRLRKSIRNEWLLVLAGLASVVLGVLLAAFPQSGALALVLWIGAYALVTGVLYVLLAFRLRGWGREHGRPDVSYVPGAEAKPSRG